MKRRELVAGVLAVAGWGSAPEARIAGRLLQPSGAIASKEDGQVIEWLDIQARNDVAVLVQHSGVTVRNCRIRHGIAHGIHGERADDLVLQNLDIDRLGTFERDERHPRFGNNIDLRECSGPVIRRVKASRGSSNIYLEDCERAKLQELELHDVRGPYPRGQNVQLNGCPHSTVEQFSAENGSESWTEDNVSVFRSDGCVIRRGLVAYNNSPTGDGVMLEGSFDCLVEDVDAVEQGNGAFAAVPVEDTGSGGCVFRRCRTRASYNSPRDGRDKPSSDGLSFYMQISRGARRHSIVECHYDALANRHNLIWDTRAVNPGWGFTPLPFTPRPPVRLRFE